MHSISMPACYFPSTVVFVDDHKDFLQNFIVNFNSRLTTQLFFSAKEALSVFKENTFQNNDISHRVINEIYNSETTDYLKQTLHLNVSTLHWEVYNPGRFNEISVVIVDYAMPEMNGLEFCERIRHHPVKKILLTGQANEETAIQAFNKGVIDRYIPKHLNNLATVVEETTKELQLQYFNEMSDFVVKLISAQKLSCLQDEKFQQFFQSVCQQHHIVEYYLLEPSGSFLLLDSDANVSCLVVKNDADLDRYCQIAKTKNLSFEVIQPVMSRKKIPYFWQSSESIHNDWNDWSYYLYPADKIIGNEAYYIALIKDSYAFDIQRNRILSYKNYLKQKE